MRWLLRSALLWLILAPLAWVYGTPHLLRYVEQEAKAQNSAACHRQVSEASAILPPERIDSYCDCLNEALHFEREDLFEMVKTRTAPVRINKALEARVTQCNPILHGQAPQPQHPAPDTPKTNPDGSVEMYL